MTSESPRRGPASRHRHALTHRWAPFFAAVLALVGGGVAVLEARIVGDLLERPGLEEFYLDPVPESSGDPGEIMRQEELIGLPFDTRAWRILYRSTDLNGEPLIVSGIVVAPLGPPPAGGRTVLSWGHPTTGSARDCAPSMAADPFLDIEGLRLMLDRGFVVVATDYAGMGYPGPDSYLVGATEGNNVLDAVRAAQSIPAGDAGASVVLWGHSQGGQAVLFAAERAADYAPELDVRAVAVAAPAADLTALLDADIDDISGVTIGSYAFTAYAGVYGDSVAGAQLSDILTPAAVAAAPEMNDLCLLTHTKELHAIGQPLVGNFVLSDPTTTPPWDDLLAQNSAGSVAFDAPLYIAQGLKDTLIHPQDTRDFAKHEASLGIDVTLAEVPNATHATIAYFTLPGLMAWLDAHVGL
ncbi:Secretory lipase [Microbacterium sp. C448]|uniref:lipase family protein n=1 Tax=Microbacterium sp. C448 TaxID=1177594 RepID=UPI0003DE531A|nr:lipase family protein [Microbacterium sp. C448]CDK01824.1 Secretory lipase [Microbacterium sp. C448]